MTNQVNRVPFAMSEISNSALRIRKTTRLRLQAKQRLSSTLFAELNDLIAQNFPDLSPIKHPQDHSAFAAASSALLAAHSHFLQSSARSTHFLQMLSILSENFPIQLT